MAPSEQLCLFTICQEAYVLNAWFAGLTCLATALAVFVAWLQIAAARREGRVRATFDIVERETSPEFHDIIQKCRALSDRPNNIESLQASSQNNGDDYRSVKALLDLREYAAIFFQSGGGDVDTYLKWAGPALAKEWSWLSEYIEWRRQVTKNPSLYEHAEWLAKQAQDRFPDARYLAPPSTATNDDTASLSPASSNSDGKTI